MSTFTNGRTQQDRTTRALIAQLTRRPQQQRAVSCVPLAQARWVTLHRELGLVGCYLHASEAAAVAREFGGYRVPAAGFHAAARRDARRAS